MSPGLEVVPEVVRGTVEPAAEATPARAAVPGTVLDPIPGKGVAAVPVPTISVQGLNLILDQGRAAGLLIKRTAGILRGIINVGPY